MLPNPTGSLAPWVIMLQQFDFEIRYKPGLLNKVAGPLSRQSLSNSIEISAIVDPVTCRWYHKKHEAVQQHPNDHPDYCIRGGKLYQHFFDRYYFTETEVTDPWKLCVPKIYKLPTT